MQYKFSLQHFLQYLGHGSNLDVHQQMNGYRNCSTYIQCNIYTYIYTHTYILSYKKKIFFESVLMR